MTTKSILVSFVFIFKLIFCEDFSVTLIPQYLSLDYLQSKDLTCEAKLSSGKLQKLKHPKIITNISQRRKSD